MASDFELLDAWRGGDRAAGSALLRRHFDALVRFFSNKVDDGIEDLVQRTMLACIESRDRFRGDASFRTYVFQIARNEVYRHWRGRGSDREQIDGGVTSLRDLGASPSRALVHQRRQQLLLDALRNIPLDYQIALELHYWDQLTTAELAEVLGVPQGTVKTRLRRARQLVHEWMGERDSELGQLSDPATSREFDEWATGVRSELAADVVDGGSEP